MAPFNFVCTGNSGRPQADPLPNDDINIPYFMAGDNAFALKNWMMTPYGHTHQVTPERIFSYRLSRARRIVECAFGILVSR